MRLRPLTLAEQSARMAFDTFFALVKTGIIAFVLIVTVLVAGQSTVAPVSVRLLTSYAMEYAVSSFKSYRGYFPEPFAVKFDNK